MLYVSIKSNTIIVGCLFGAAQRMAHSEKETTERGAKKTTLNKVAEISPIAIHLKASDDDGDEPY